MGRPKNDARLKQAIEALTRAGKSQKEIAAVLQVHRNSVYRYQRNCGLTAWSTIPSAAKEKTILGLLRAGVSRKRVEKLARTTEYFVRKIAEAHGITGRVDPLSPEQHERLREEVRRHGDYAWNLAVKYNISYKRTLKIAHAELGVPVFIGAAHQPPLMSRFAEKRADAAVGRTKADDAEALRLCVELVLRVCDQRCLGLSSAFDSAIVSAIVQVCLDRVPAFQNQSPKTIADFTANLHQAIVAIRSNARQSN